jgi:hypothetical protein
MKRTTKLIGIFVALCAATGLRLDAADFPLGISSSKRHLVDARGVPFLIHGDAAWSIMVQLSLEDAEVYLENRRQKGFNCIVANLLESFYASNPPRNFYGQAPFTTPGDFATPNGAYFEHAGRLLAKAAEKGILVMLNPCYLGYDGGPGVVTDGWAQDVVRNGPAKCRAYGQYLGDRYKGYNNIIWVAGGDQTPQAGSAVEQNCLQILLGIKDRAPAHLWTAHWNEGAWQAVDVAAFRPYMNLNAVYQSRQSVIYQQLLQAYAGADVRPAFLWEAWYEGPNWVGEVTRPETVRRQAYWSNLSGSTGQNFGSTYVWSFAARTGTSLTNPDWRSGMERQGSREMVFVRELFKSLPWTELVPDQEHSVVTAGYGTMGQTDYVTAARTRDGTRAVAYVPSTGTGERTFTVNLSRLNGTVTARWYNPTNGRFSDVAGSPFPAGSGSRNFTTPGDNGTGANDWVLLLEGRLAPAPPLNLRVQSG